MRSAAILLLALVAAACSHREVHPRITARLTTVYHETLVLEDFAFLYWWEERGETPFLKPKERITTDYIVETLTPLPDQPDRVMVTTRSIPLADIALVEISLIDTGKKVLITARDGSTIEATTSFPRSLREDPKSGIADHKIFVTGTLRDNGAARNHRQELDYITRIEILAVQPPA